MIIPVFVSIVNLGHLTKVVSLIPAYGEVYLIQHYGIKFVSDLQYVSSFLCVLRFPPPVKLTKRHFQQYFSYIVEVSFIGGGKRITQKKPPTCHK
jgi:hypothetical protein